VIDYAYSVIIQRHGQCEHSRWAIVEDAQVIARYLTGLGQRCRIALVPA